MYLSIGQVAKLTGVSRSSLRRWEKEEILVPDYRTPGNHRRYSYNKVLNFVNATNAVQDQQSLLQQTKETTVVIYGRVSAQKQKDDLQRQIDQLKEYATEQNWQIIGLYYDIASGLNDNRKALQRMILDLARLQPDYLLCTYRDRIARFGTAIIEQICKIFGTTLVEMENQDHQSDPQEDLVQAILAILYSFAGKLYRQRRKPPVLLHEKVRAKNE